MMKKTLTRIRLINWHYFENEVINVNGSFLISGENTAGKSTVLDAIQLVLTTNHRKFNTAANEKSNRDLKGYVRCKTGNEDNAYIRSGTVITYVALEFYEEKSTKYFTLGVKIDSPDEESKLTVKWFREECRSEELSFLTGGRPSTTEEFRRNDKKVQLISQISEAKARFGQRLGNLEDRFFDMMPKSLAFKPMDNVKEFINRFILSEKAIEVATLRNNIASLKELEDLMDMTKEKIDDLKDILLKNEEIIAKDREIKTNEILIRKAEVQAKQLEVEELEKNNQTFKQQLQSQESKLGLLDSSLRNKRDRHTSLQVALGQNETAQLIKDAKHRIEILNKDKDNAQQALGKLNNMLRTASEALALLNQFEVYVISKEELMSLGLDELDVVTKSDILYKLKKELSILLETHNSDNVRQKDLLEKFTSQKIKLNQEILNLKNKKLTYPENTIKLMTAIEKEFLTQGIRSEPRIFSDLLEISDSRWQNAVEGYLNTQRFYVIVEPQHYRVAIEVYNKLKNEIHTVGLVNTNKLDINAEVDANSLAHVVKCDNRWGKAYSIYLLNRVIRCENVDALKEHKVAITPDCMLYQNYAVRKIDEKVYRTPYIGAYAFEVQLKNRQADLEAMNTEIEAAQQNLKRLQSIIDKLSVCNLDVLEENIEAPHRMKIANELIQKEKVELKKAESDPNYIQIQIQIEECSKQVNILQEEYNSARESIGRLKNQVDSNVRLINEMAMLIVALENNFKTLCDNDLEIAEQGLSKFNEQIKLKTPVKIVQNFSPMKVGMQNKKNDLSGELINTT